MSLSERVLLGIQNRWRVLVKDLLRSKQSTKVECGRWLQRQGTPSSLLEARGFLSGLIEYIDARLNSSVKCDFLVPLKGTVKDLLQAVLCAESRDGLGEEALVEGALQGDLSVTTLLSRGCGFSLAANSHCLPARA